MASVVPYNAPAIRMPFLDLTPDEQFLYDLYMGPDSVMHATSTPAPPLGHDLSQFSFDFPPPGQQPIPFPDFSSFGSSDKDEKIWDVSRRPSPRMGCLTPPPRSPYNPARIGSPPFAFGQVPEGPSTENGVPPSVDYSQSLSSSTLPTVSEHERPPSPMDLSDFGMPALSLDSSAAELPIFTIAPSLFPNLRSNHFAPMAIPDPPSPRPMRLTHNYHTAASYTACRVLYPDIDTFDLRFQPVEALETADYCPLPGCKILTYVDIAGVGEHLHRCHKISWNSRKLYDCGCGCKLLGGQLAAHISGSHFKADGVTCVPCGAYVGRKSEFADHLYTCEVLKEAREDARKKRQAREYVENLMRRTKRGAEEMDDAVSEVSESMEIDNDEEEDASPVVLQPPANEARMASEPPSPPLQPKSISAPVLHRRRSSISVLDSPVLPTASMSSPVFTPVRHPAAPSPASEPLTHRQRYGGKFVWDYTMGPKPKYTIGERAAIECGFPPCSPTKPKSESALSAFTRPSRQTRSATRGVGGASSSASGSSTSASAGPSAHRAPSAPVKRHIGKPVSAPAAAEVTAPAPKKARRSKATPPTGMSLSAPPKLGKSSTSTKSASRRPSPKKARSKEAPVSVAGTRCSLRISRRNADTAASA